MIDATPALRKVAGLGCLMLAVVFFRPLIHALGAPAAPAVSLAAEPRAETRTRAAEGVVELVSELTRDVHLDERDRRSLRTARVRLAEARLKLASGKLDLAARLTDEALDHLRTAVGRLGTRAARYVEEPRTLRWRAEEAAAIRWSHRNRAPAVVVNKERNRLTLYLAGEPAGTFEADMGRNHLEAKLHAGDRATPEGRYRITRKKDEGRSTYHKGLELSYPNDDDRRRHLEAVRSGRVSTAVDAGNSIEIHGEGGRGRDWTEGCIALSSPDIDRLFDAVRVGTPVTIIGGDGEGGRFSSLVARLAVARESIDAVAKY